MTRAFAALSIVLALGCAGDIGESPGDDGGFPDAGHCTVFLTFDPTNAIAAPETKVRAIAHVSGALGVLAYTWTVRYEGAIVPTQLADADGAAVWFDAPNAGVYDVMVDVSSNLCPTGQATYNVGVAGGATTQVRLRVTPPPTMQAPPSERLVLVTGGASFDLGTVVVDTGVLATGSVFVPSGDGTAYLRFIPLGAADAYVEAYADAGGSYQARVLNQPHDVLIVPRDPNVAPVRVRNWLPGTFLQPLGSSVVVQGTVRGPDDAPIANANVQLMSDGVPSTRGTTSSTGAFTLLVAEGFEDGEVTVEVTPPPATGLPRLVATSATLDLDQPLAVRYATTLARRNIGGATVRRGGSALPGAKVTVTGTISAAGTITAGTAASARGEVRVVATTNASGALPSALAPAVPLSAVVAVNAGDHAVAPFDLTTALPSTIDAPATQTITTQLQGPTGTPLAGAVLELAPIGALAMAGATPVRAVAGSNGAVTARVASGGRYELRAVDPAGRAAPVVVLDVGAATIVATYTLGPAIEISGTLLQSGSSVPVGRAALQLRCTGCSGIDRTRSLAEGTSGPSGEFAIAVRDPGTM